MAGTDIRLIMEIVKALLSPWSHIVKTQPVSVRNISPACHLSKKFQLFQPQMVLKSALFYACHVYDSSKREIYYMSLKIKSTVKDYTKISSRWIRSYFFDDIQEDTSRRHFVIISKGISGFFSERDKYIWVSSA